MRSLARAARLAPAARISAASSRTLGRSGRFYTSHSSPVVAVAPAYSSKLFLALLGASAGFLAGYKSLKESEVDAAEKQTVDFRQVRKDLEALLENAEYDDGSYGPVLVRLSWHAAGTFNKEDNTGGPSGATMRFSPESEHGANAGLHVARKVLEPLHAKYPGLSFSDLWALAAVVAIENMGGPKILWRPGRSDKSDAKHCTPDGRLPDAAQGADHIRAVFSRMGFTDQEIVALAGAHALGRCHRDRSGYEGPWTHSPTMFSNDYFVQLMERKWTPRPLQYEDETKMLMMLPADLAFLKDPTFHKYVELYAKNEEKFFADFAKAFQKLQELGVKFDESKNYVVWLTLTLLVRLMEVLGFVSRISKE